MALVDTPLDEPRPRPARSAKIDLRRLSPTDGLRLVEIALTLARHGVLVVARRGPWLVLRPRQQAPRSLAVALRRSAVDLGPTFVKLGQIVASSPGLFPDTLSQEFRKLLDRVPPIPTSRVKRIIERELRMPIAEAFASFDETPVAAASIAQVHRATLPDGTDVAVKVRRPGLRHSARRDLRLLRLGALLLERGGRLGWILNPVAIIDDFAETLAAELDFRNEAHWMVEFDRNLRSFGDNRHVIVPTPIEGMCTARVLVMTYIEGIPVDDVERLRETGHDFEELLRLGVRSWLEAAFEHGLFHGDVHAGNLMVTPTGEVAMLDFGIVGELDDQLRAALRDALPGLMVADDPVGVMQAFARVGATGRRFDAEAAAADVQRMLEPLTRKAISEISYGEVLQVVLQVATTHGLRLPKEMVLVVKQLLYFERYAKELAPDYWILDDPRLVTYLLPEYMPEVPRPVLSTRPRTEPVDGDFANGLIVESLRDAHYSWVYDVQRPELRKLYAKAQKSQWNVTTDLDWSIDVDPLDPNNSIGVLPISSAAGFDKMTDRERGEASHHFNAWLTSQFLHGEQGALLATSKLTVQVPDLDAKYYAATQVFDEARHVEAYSRYLQEKLELTYPVNQNLQELLELIIGDPRWDVTYLGMQIIVEGLALAAFGLIHQFSTEPLIKSITRQVMADEARHVAFGALALNGFYTELSSSERREREDFVLEAAWLMRDRFLATEVWERVGLSPDDGMLDAMRQPMMQIFQRVLFAKITPNLQKIGLLSERLREQLIGIGVISL